jgi:hypothetical protein
MFEMDFDLSAEVNENYNYDMDCSDSDYNDDSDYYKEFTLKAEIMRDYAAEANFKADELLQQSKYRDVSKASKMICQSIIFKKEEEKLLKIAEFYYKKNNDTCNDTYTDTCNEIYSYIDIRKPNNFDRIILSKSLGF